MDVKNSLLLQAVAPFADSLTSLLVERSDDLSFLTKLVDVHAVDIKITKVTSTAEGILEKSLFTLYIIRGEQG